MKRLRFFFDEADVLSHNLLTLLLLLLLLLVSVSERFLVWLTSIIAGVDCISPHWGEECVSVLLAMLMIAHEIFSYAVKAAADTYLQA